MVSVQPHPSQEYPGEMHCHPHHVQTSDMSPVHGNDSGQGPTMNLSPGTQHGTLGWWVTVSGCLQPFLPALNHGNNHVLSYKGIILYQSPHWKWRQWYGVIDTRIEGVDNYISLSSYWNNHTLTKGFQKKYKALPCVLQYPQMSHSHSPMTKIKIQTLMQLP